MSEQTPWYKKKWVIILGVIIVVGVIGSFLPKQDLPAINDKDNELQIPESQSAFISKIVEGEDAYNAATTDIQRGDALRIRNDNLCTDFNGDIEDWVGTIKDVSTNSQGKGSIGVRISSKGDSTDIELKTWSNAISDTGDNTLVEQDSELFKKLLNLNKDDKVTITGKLVATGTKCLQTSNATETASVVSPDFIMKFSDINPI